jgi:hypothetical protein
MVLINIKIVGEHSEVFVIFEVLAAVSMKNAVFWGSYVVWLLLRTDVSEFRCVHQ